MNEGKIVLYFEGSEISIEYVGLMELDEKEKIYDERVK